MSGRIILYIYFHNELEGTNNNNNNNTKHGQINVLLHSEITKSF